MTQKRTLFLLFIACICMGISSCNPYKKQIPTGFPIEIKNVYTNPQYDHSRITSVLALPIDNPSEQATTKFAALELQKTILRNFGKFNYFNIHTPNKVYDQIKSPINLDSGTIDRLRIGALGDEYYVQGILHVSISDYRPYSPMHMHVKAILVDSSSGEKVWSIDQVFDMKDANVVNGFRCWWNSERSGGLPNSRFSMDLQNPNVFTEFVFHSIAKSYGLHRVKNHLEVKRMASKYS